MIMTRECISNAGARLDDFREGNLLVFEASTQESKAIATADLREFIAFEFSLVPEVEYVFTAFRENQIFYAWIVTDKFEDSVRDQIYEREQAIIDEFSMFDFDFYIIARMGRSLDDLIGDDSMHLTYARK